MAVRAGTAGDDTISGTRGDDLLAGLAGDDRIKGGNGDDIISGGEGSDRLTGGRGDDILIMDTDDRVINGGQGSDVAVLYGTNRQFTLDDNFRNVEGVQDVPNASTTVTLDADVLKHLDGNSLQFALGDGVDEVRIVGGDPEDFHKQGDQLIWDDRVTLSFEGVEQVSLVTGRDGHSKIIAFNEGIDQAGGLTGKDSPAGKTADALSKGNHGGDITQQADVTQLAEVQGGHRGGGGTVDQSAKIDQQANAGRGGTIDQSADIDQQASAGKGGSIDQDAFIKQWASTSGGGDVSQSANISQSATVNGSDDYSPSWENHGTTDFFHLA